MSSLVKNAISRPIIKIAVWFFLYRFSQDHPFYQLLFKIKIRLQWASILWISCPFVYRQGYKRYKCYFFPFRMTSLCIFDIQRFSVLTFLIYVVEQEPCRDKCLWQDYDILREIWFTYFNTQNTGQSRIRFICNRATLYIERLSACRLGIYFSFVVWSTNQLTNIVFIEKYLP